MTIIEVVERKLGLELNPVSLKRQKWGPIATRQFPGSTLIVLTMNIVGLNENRESYELALQIK